MRIMCIKGKIGIIFQHFITLILKQGTDFDVGGRVGWQSRGETNTAADRRGSTSGTFWDCGRGKTVPGVQSLPNLHQVSGIKGSISALAFHVWLNHPGQCVRCWTKRILWKKTRRRKTWGSALYRERLLVERMCLLKIPFWKRLFHYFTMILINVWHLNIQLHLKLVYWEYRTLWRLREKYKIWEAELNTLGFNELRWI